MATLSDFLNQSPEDFNLIFEGFVDIENGAMAVGTRNFDSCEGGCSGYSTTEYQFDCKKCGRTTKNHIFVPTGMGDGNYPVAQITSGGQAVGLVAYFDDEDEFFRNFMSGSFDATGAPQILFDSLEANLGVYSPVRIGSLDLGKDPATLPQLGPIDSGTTTNRFTAACISRQLGDLQSNVSVQSFGLAPGKYDAYAFVGIFEDEIIFRAFFLLHSGSDVGQIWRSINDDDSQINPALALKIYFAGSQNDRLNRKAVEVLYANLRVSNQQVQDFDRLAALYEGQERQIDFVINGWLWTYKLEANLSLAKRWNDIAPDELQASILEFREFGPWKELLGWAEQPSIPLNASAGYFND